MDDGLKSSRALEFCFLGVSLFVLLGHIGANYHEFFSVIDLGAGITGSMIIAWLTVLSIRKNTDQIIYMEDKHELRERKRKENIKAEEIENVANQVMLGVYGLYLDLVPLLEKYQPVYATQQEYTRGLGVPPMMADDYDTSFLNNIHKLSETQHKFADYKSASDIPDDLQGCNLALIIWASQTSRKITSRLTRRNGLHLDLIKRVEGKPQDNGAILLTGITEKLRHSDLTAVLVATEDLVETVHDIMNCILDTLQNFPKFVNDYLDSNYSYKGKINGFHFKDVDLDKVRAPLLKLSKIEMNKINSAEFP